MKKRHLYMATAALCFALASCGNDKTINGKIYQTFGIANESSQRDPEIAYEISVGSVLCAVFFWETAIVPIYVIGWDLWQPVSARIKSTPPAQVPQ